MKIAQSDGTLAKETKEEFNAFFAKPDFIHYICLLTRPRITDCCTTLEQKLYKPGTKRNEKFFLRFIEWENLTWCIVSIPYYEKEYMEMVAVAYKMRVANGIPTMISDGSITYFPVNTPQSFTVEHLH